MYIFLFSVINSIRIHEVFGFNFVNSAESPTTIIMMIMSTAILNELSPLMRSASPNAQTQIKRIGNKYFNMKTHVFPTLMVENSFNNGMSFSTP